MDEELNNSKRKSIKGYQWHVGDIPPLDKTLIGRQLQKRCWLQHPIQSWSHGGAVDRTITTISSFSGASLAPGLSSWKARW